MNLSLKRAWGVIWWGAFAACGALAQDEDPNLAGMVTVAAPGVERVSALGESKPIRGGDAVFYDESMVTPPGGEAWLALRERRGVVQLKEGARAGFVPVDVDDQPVSLEIILERGQATVMTRSSDDRWLVVAVGEGGRSGYALLRGGSVAVDARGPEVTFTARSGEVRVYRGAAPERGPLDAAGAPVAAADAALSAGESVVLGTLARSPAALPDIAPVQGLYALGLRQADRWVGDAEQGDFTPQRVEARGGGGTFLAQTSTAFSFDQARAPVAVTARAATPIVTNVRSNPAQELLESRVPTSVVVGQRFLRTRIVGNPGTGGSVLSANPFADRLIILGGGR